MPRVDVLLRVILRNILLSSGLTMRYRILVLLGDDAGWACGILGPAMRVIPPPFIGHLLTGLPLQVGNQLTKRCIVVCCHFLV